MQNDDQFDFHKMKVLIGLANPSGELYKQRTQKYQQLANYYEIFKSVLKKMTTKRKLYLYDCACGKSYLSFYLNYYLKKDGIDNIEFVCIDTNSGLIEKCSEAAKELKMENMNFFNSSVVDFEVPYKPDVIYSLHACNYATDQLIFKGIIENSSRILSVSCCQHTTREQLKRHPLTTITRHKPYKERIVDMVSDSLRALILEAFGYNVKVFEFTPATYTPKNIMLRCEKGNIVKAKTEIAMDSYIKLSNMFNVHPLLEKYLQDQLCDISEVYKEYRKSEKIHKILT